MKSYTSLKVHASPLRVFAMLQYQLMWSKLLEGSCLAYSTGRSLRYFFFTLLWVQSLKAQTDLHSLVSLDLQSGAQFSSWRWARAGWVSTLWRLHTSSTQSVKSSDGLHPSSDGFQPKSDCLQPKSDCLQPKSKRNLMAFVTTSFLLLLVGHLLLVAMHLLLLASCQTCSVESRGEGHEFVNCLTPLPRLDSSHLVSFL